MRPKSGFFERKKFWLGPKEILQIDATIIAGLLILLTISNIGENQTIPQIVESFIEKDQQLIDKIDNKEIQLEEFNDDLEKNQHEKNIIQDKIDRLNKKPEEIQKQIDQITQERKELNQNLTKTTQEGQIEIMLRFDELDTLKNELIQNLTKALQKPGYDKLLQELHSADQRIDNFKSKINTTENEINILTLNMTQTREEFKLGLKEKTSSFLKTPEDWVYQIGLPFSTSAILAVIATIFERWDVRKVVSLAVTWSLIFMGIGFAFAFATFFVIGGGQSYLPDFFG